MRYRSSTARAWFHLIRFASSREEVTLKEEYSGDKEGA
jgi:hypothetical protein